jgi:hypothetical protein
MQAGTSQNTSESIRTTLRPKRVMILSKTTKSASTGSRLCLLTEVRALVATTHLCMFEVKVEENKGSIGMRVSRSASAKRYLTDSYRS